MRWGSTKRKLLGSQCGGAPNHPPLPQISVVSKLQLLPPPPPRLKEGCAVPPVPPIPGGQRPGVAERVGQPGGVAATWGGPGWGLRAGLWWWWRGGILRPPRVPQVPIPQPLQRQPLLAAALLGRGGGAATPGGLGGGFGGRPPPIDQSLGAVATAGAGGCRESRGGGRWWLWGGCDPRRGHPQLGVLTARPRPGGQPRGLRAGGGQRSQVGWGGGPFLLPHCPFLPLQDPVFTPLGPNTSQHRFIAPMLPHNCPPPPPVPPSAPIISIPLPLFTPQCLLTLLITPPQPLITPPNPSLPPPAPQNNS